MSNKEQQKKQQLPYPHPEGNDTPETTKNKEAFPEDEKDKIPKEENPDEYENPYEDDNLDEEENLDNEHPERKHQKMPNQNQDDLRKGL